MTTSDDLLALTVKALKGQGGAPATDAGANVFSPGDWSTWRKDYPAILARVVSEEKTSLGRAVVEFLVTATVQLSLRVSVPAALADAGAFEAEEQAWRLKRQAEIAVINSQPLTGLLQQFPFVRAQLKFSSEGEEHLAEVLLDVGMEFYQGPEDFAPMDAALLTEVAVQPQDGAPPTAVAIDITLPQ